MALNKPKYCCLFVHFNARNTVDGYVYTYLQHLSAVFGQIIFISNSNILPKDRKRLSTEIKQCRIEIRENKGADLGAWKDIIEQNIVPLETDYLILTNDSIFGPLHQLEAIVEEMNARNGIDFWGLTDSYQGNWHIQSYFICLSRKVFLSEAFKKIFATDFSSLSKKDIILKGELNLSQFLTNAGFKGCAYIPYTQLDPEFESWDAKNPTHFYWDILIKRFNFPFIKKELLLQNPDSIQNIQNIFTFLENKKHYPVGNIEDSISDFIQYSNEVYNISQKISVICHLYYPGSIYYFLSRLYALNSPKTTFIFNLADSLISNSFLLRLLKKHFPGSIVINSPNQGRDIGGKLAAIDTLIKTGVKTEYSLLIHDKLSPHTQTGVSWRDKLLKIISPLYLDKVFKKFEQNKKNGLITSHDMIKNEFDPDRNAFTCTSSDNLLNYIKEFNLNVTDYTFAAGTIFWIKTEILSNFFSVYSPLDIRKKLERGNALDFDNGTNTHAWERLFSFITNSQGFKTVGI